MKPLHVTVALCLGFIAVVVGMFVYSVTRTPVLSAEALREQGVLLLPQPRELSPFVLETSAGAIFDPASLQGRWSFLFFGFTNCPDVCPTSMSVLGQAYRKLVEQDPAAADNFQGILVTVDPERDTAEKLNDYVQAFSPSFIGVRGSVKDIAGLATEVNVAFAKVPVRDAQGAADPNTYTMDHSANIVIINPKGHYHGFIKYPQQVETIVAAYQSLDAGF
jgi:protein SCO1/2